MQGISDLLAKVQELPAPLKAGAEETGSSLVEAKPAGETSSVLVQLTDTFIALSRDDMWYELYKSITNEKDMAEKD